MPVPETSALWCEKGDQADRQFSIACEDGASTPFEDERSSTSPGEGGDGEEKRVGYRDGIETGAEETPDQLDRVALRENGDRRVRSRR